MKNFILCLMGPTASGKTALALKIAAQIPSEIISVDSGMIYRGMNVGTAKPNLEELELVKHHLIDICEPSEIYSAAQFREEALRLINEILAKGKLPLLVGGTMMYFKILLQGISPLPPANPEIRDRIWTEAKKVGWDKMHEKLQKIDQLTAARISPNDSQRIQRALEVYEITGKSITELWQKFPSKPLSNPHLNIAIMPTDRSTLDAKIAKRFDFMLQNGFIEEVEKLYQRVDLHPDLPAIRSIGYRQAWEYLANKISFEEMQEKILIATHQLAKRQTSWLRSLPDILWFDSEDNNTAQKIMHLIEHNV